MRGLKTDFPQKKWKIGISALFEDWMRRNAQIIENYKNISSFFFFYKVELSSFLFPSLPLPFYHKDFSLENWEKNIRNKKHPDSPHSMIKFEKKLNKKIINIKRSQKRLIQIILFITFILYSHKIKPKFYFIIGLYL